MKKIYATKKNLNQIGARAPPKKNRKNPDKSIYHNHNIKKNIKNILAVTSN
jgi:hypothetical protein